MISTKSRITQQRLDQALADIQQFISASKNWQLALNHLSSIKDYAMGEERFCSASQALEHCGRIRGMLPESASENAFRNLEAIAEEIRQLQQEGGISAPSFDLLVPGLMLVALAVVLYFLFTQ
jgi:hypothetical protein